jgi:hypothetical protein
MIHHPTSLPAPRRVNFYESCLAELKKELGKYVRHHVGTSNPSPFSPFFTADIPLHRSPREDTNKVSKSLTKVLRNAASAERNKQLQSFLFLQAHKYETLDGDRANSLARTGERYALKIH